MCINCQLFHQTTVKYSKNYLHGCTLQLMLHEAFPTTTVPCYRTSPLFRFIPPVSYIFPYNLCITDATVIDFLTNYPNKQLPSKTKWLQWLINTHKLPKGMLQVIFHQVITIMRTMPRLYRIRSRDR